MGSPQLALLPSLVALVSAACVAAGAPNETWVTLAAYDCTAHCSGKNNTPAYGCLPAIPQKTQLACRHWAAALNYPAYAFQSKPKSVFP